MQAVADAARIVITSVPRLGHERVALAEALGRVLAQDVIATRDLPSFDNSAMDGYAARAADLPGSLPLAGVVAAGPPSTLAIPPGAAVRIFTGAPMPLGLDTVVMQEVAELDGDAVRLPHAERGAHVRRRGEDIAVGQPVLAAGLRLSAWHIGVIAALGVAELDVVRAPRVALLATGDELVALGTQPGPGQLVDSSMAALAALVTEAGGIPIGIGIARDDVDEVAAMIATALASDVVITTGGVSVGDRDHVHAALAANAVPLEVTKVAMRPGKPFSFGVRPGRGTALPTPVFGLPGNPVSTIVSFELFVRPALLAMQGAIVTERPRALVELVGGYRKTAGRAHYLRVRIVRDGDRLVAHPHPQQGSAMMSALATSNALVELSAETTEILPGGRVPAILLEAT